MTCTQPLPLRRSLVFLLSLTLGVVCFGLVGTSVAQEPSAQGPSATQPGASDDAASDNTRDGAPATELETPSATTAGVGQLKVELEPQEITVGDLVTATLSLVWMGAEPDEAPRFPTWQETWGRAEILQRGEVTSRVDDSGRRLYNQQLTLTSFEVGEVSVPAPTVVIPLGDRSVDVTAEDAASFQVVSVLPPEAQKDADDDAAADQPAEDNAEATGAEDTESALSLEPKPAANPRALRDVTSFAITAAALSLLNLLAGGLLVRRLRHAAGELSEAPEPWVPPLEGLLSQLDGVDPNGDSEPVHTAISLALRRYLSRHLAWNAAGSTTSEIQRQLRSTRVTPAMTQSLVQLFKDCDQVKFARQQVSPSVNSDRLARAREMGRSLEVFLVPQVTPPPETAQDRVPSGSTASKPSTSSKPPAPPTPNPQVSA